MAMSEPFDFGLFFDDLRFLEIVRQEARRTILCEPGQEHRIRALVDQQGAADVITVKASPACRPGTVLIVDEEAIEAAGREAAQGLLRDLQRKPWSWGLGGS